MIGLPSKPSQQVAQRTVYFVPTALLANNQAASSLWIDGTTLASTLYPRNFNDNSNLGGVNGYLNSQYAPNSGTITSRFASFSNAMAQNESRYLVAENFFNKYKQWLSVGINTDLIDISTQTMVQLNQISDIYPISGNKFIFLGTRSSDNAAYLRCGEVQTSGLITWGTAVPHTDATPWNHYYGGIASIDTDKFVFVYRKITSGVVMIVVGSISGTTITLGTPVQVDATVDNNATVCKLDTNKVLVAYTDPSTFVLYANAITISALVPTIGIRVTGEINPQGNLVWALQDGTDKAIIGHRDDTGGGAGMNVCIATVSGTTVTLGTEVNVFNGANSEGYCYRADAGWYGGAIMVATDKFLVMSYENTVGRNNVKIITISGLVPSVATSQYIYYLSGSYSKLVEVTAGSRYAYYNGSTGTAVSPVSTLLDIDGSNNVTALYTKTNTLTGAGYDKWAYDKVGNYVVGIRYANSSVDIGYVTASVGAILEFYNSATQIGSAVTVSWALVYQPFPLGVVAGAIGGSRAYLRVKKTSTGTDIIKIGDVVVNVE